MYLFGLSVHLLLLYIYWVAKKDNKTTQDRKQTYAYPVCLEGYKKSTMILHMTKKWET